MTIWIQTNNKGEYIEDFCAISELGARQWKIPFKKFHNAENIPLNPYNVIVGSVESCEIVLNNMKLEVPPPIDMLKLAPISGRKFEVKTKEKFLEYYELFPYFIKPYDKHKQFPAFIAKDKGDVLMYTNKINNVNFLISNPLSIISEYRLYINKKKILGMKHYSGDPFVYPDPLFIKKALDFCYKNLNLLSYSLDFGILQTGETILIEAQDAWAIGNYGLEPYDYIKFVKDRWLQITKILEK